MQPNENNNSRIEILECTLRDGSYAIDYQFTAEDTAVLCAALESAGFMLIEIGHGLGLNASGIEHGIAAASDEEYLSAAASALTKAKFGMFCIPGIARVQDLDTAAKYGMGFVRIGTNVTEVENAEPFIKRAKELGMSVSSNLMKSYAVPLDEFLRKVEQVVAYGADIVCVVDSAGGMLPQDVREYVQGARATVPAKVGFHGHNNLLLAVANSLEAINSGAHVIDTSMQGMGRSAGNAQTEIMVILLEKMGYKTEVDFYRAMDIGERLVRPIMGGVSGIDSISATLGHAQFHSSYLKLIYRIAQKYGIDPRELIIKVSEVDKVLVTEELADRVAAEIEAEMATTEQKRLAWNINLDFKEIFEKHEESQIAEIAADIASEMMVISKKTNKQTIFAIALTQDKQRDHAVFPFLRQNASYVIGNAEVADLAQAEKVASAVDGLVDIILFDLPLSIEASGKVVKKSKVLNYRDEDALVRAVDLIVDRLAQGVCGKQTLIIGELNRSAKLALNLAERGALVKLITSDATTLPIDNVLAAISGGDITCLSSLGNIDGEVQIVIAVTPYQAIIDIDLLSLLPEGALVVDAGPGCIADQAIAYGIDKGLSLLRVDMRAGLSGEIVNVLETDELKERIMGRRNIAGVPVVAGGIIGEYGDIVIDCITEPTRVIGVADAKGKLLKPKEAAAFKDRIHQVKKALASKDYN